MPSSALSFVACKDPRVEPEDDDAGEPEDDGAGGPDDDDAGGPEDDRGVPVSI
jgi:hypothetical protein